MRHRGGYASYQQFKREVLGHQIGPLSSSVEDVADDMYKANFGDEAESLWDPVDSDDE